jgi:hypothetical protein
MVGFLYVSEKIFAAKPFKINHFPAPYTYYHNQVRSRKRNISFGINGLDGYWY